MCNKKPKQPEVSAGNYSPESPTNPSRYSCGSKPFRPIYPVRYGLRPSFIKNDKAQANLKTRPTALAITTTHWLETLRQGYIYIYAPNGHKGSDKQGDRTASDERGNWIVFRYNTDSEDISGNTDSPHMVSDNSQGQYNFVRYDFVKKNEQGEWVLGDATNEWKKEDGQPIYDSPFIHDDTSKCYVAYCEYQWTQALFEKIENDDVLRDKLMTEVNPVPTSSEGGKPQYQPQKQVGLLKDISNHVINFAITTDGAEYPEEFTNTKLNIINQQRYTEIVPLSVNFCPNSLDKGLFVAITDTIGEIQELALYQGIVSEHYEKYKAEYTYPMTIGDIIHPKLMYKLRKLKYPNKGETLYEKYTKKLDKNFLGEYGRIAGDAITYFENPLKDIVKVRKQLKERESFVALLEVLSQIVLTTEPKQACLAASLFFCKVGVAFSHLESSPEGEMLISSTLGVKSSDDDLNLGGWADYTKSVMDGMIKIVVNIKGNKYQSSVLSPYYRAMELYYHSSGKTMIKNWMMDLDGSKNLSISSEKLFKIYDMDSLGKTPKAWLEAYIEDLLDIEDKAMLDRHIKRNPRRRRKKELGNLLKERLKVAVAGITQGEIDVIAKNKIRDARIGRLDFFVGVLGTFTALLSLNSDSALQRKLSATPEGKLANEPLVIKTAAILDIVLFTWDKSPVYMPSKFKLPTTQVGQLSAVGNRGLAYGVIGLNIIAGIAGMIIAHGGMKEAEASGDNLAYWSYRSIFWAGAVTTFGGVASFAEMSTFAAAFLSGVLLLALCIVLIAAAIIFIFVDNDYEKWLANCFWGSSSDYPFWQLEPRGEVEEMIEKAKLLAQATDQLSEADKKTQRIITKGFSDELYGLGILSGLKIKVNKKTGKVSIHCAEFTHTEPTLKNLVVKVVFFEKTLPAEKPLYGDEEFSDYDLSSDNYKEKLIKGLTQTGQMVSFTLDEKIKKMGNYAIYATFTDDDNDVFKDSYETIAYTLENMDYMDE